MNHSRVIRLLLAAVALLPHCAKPETPPASEAQALQVGQLAPDIKGLSQTGHEVRASQFLEPAVAIVFCSNLEVSCAAIAQRIGVHWRDHQQQISMVLQLTPGSWHENRALSARLGLPHLLVSDRDGSIAKSFGLEPLPRIDTAFLLGKDRKVLQWTAALDTADPVASLLQVTQRNTPAPGQ